MLRRTKIVATVGPASWDEPVLRHLIQEGVDVVRLNFSHAQHAKAAQIIEMVRRLAKELNRNVAILQDLQGPRIRIGEVEGTLTLKVGQEVVLTADPIKATTPERIGIDYAELPLDVKQGNRILIDEGLIQLTVTGTTTTEVHCLVVIGGNLTSHKGINVPHVTLGVPTITEKDKEDLRFGLEHDVDFVALSFVRRGQDIDDLRQLMEEYSGKNTSLELPFIIAKIEKHEAITNFEEILAAADGIMVARGDLGVEMAAEQLPVLQKMIIRRCREVGKSVITATQMLDSMIRNPRPTRAEATDVANAILDGTDATMLSGESANGLYPIEAVRTMGRIAETVEQEILLKQQEQAVTPSTADSITDAISQAVVDIARELKAQAILALTTSGFTARMIARNRPHVPLYVATRLERTHRRAALIWGAQAIMSEFSENTDALFASAEKALVDHNLVKAGDTVIITGGIPVGIPGQTNTLRVHVVPE